MSAPSTGRGGLATRARRPSRRARVRSGAGLERTSRHAGLFGGKGGRSPRPTARGGRPRGLWEGGRRRGESGGSGRGGRQAAAPTPPARIGRRRRRRLPEPVGSASPLTCRAVRRAWPGSLPPPRATAAPPRAASSPSSRCRGARRRPRAAGARARAVEPRRGALRVRIRARGAGTSP